MTYNQLINLIQKSFGRAKLMIYKSEIKIISKFDFNKKGTLNDSDRNCEAILFSKDRAIQLHALLSTYYEMIQNPVRINILYTCSTSVHKKSYDEIVDIFKDKEINFIYENSFRSDLISLIDNMSCEKILFMTDDAVFVDRFDFHDVLLVNPFKGVFQLHRGLDAKYNMHTGIDESLPDFYQSVELTSDHLIWDFNPGLFSVTYNYPMSLDGTIFSCKEILSLFKNISFKAPNSLESKMQIYNAIMLKRKGVCFAKSKYVNIPCNIVNLEVENSSTGYFSTEELLEFWENGYRIRYEDFYYKNFKEVVTARFSFVKRN